MTTASGSYDTINYKMIMKALHLGFLGRLATLSLPEDDRPL